jgi:cellulose synthase/poly-beta-1,6-N-acetylglucosamine synthase-like glycosyltransferase
VTLNTLTQQKSNELALVCEGELENSLDKNNLNKVNFDVLENIVSIKNENETNWSIFSLQNYCLILLFSMITMAGIIYNGEITLVTIFVYIYIFPGVINIFYDASIALAYFFFDVEAVTENTDNSTPYFPTVAVILPSCNEPYHVAKMTLDSALAIDYPADKLQVIVVDNSDVDHKDYIQWKNHVESLPDKKGPTAPQVLFIHRDGREGFKSKNLDIALTHVESEFVLFLDVDSTLKKECLNNTMHQFKHDEKLAFIQYKSIPTNIKNNSPLAMAQGVSSYLQRHIQGICMHHGHALFYGHNAIWRKSAIDKLGSCLEHHHGQVVLAEDLSMSLRTVFDGYHGKSAWHESGEWVPTSMKETEAMWLRWTVGTLQVFTKHVFKDGNFKKLSLNEKVGWFQHALTYVNSALVPFNLFFGLVFQLNSLLLIAGLSLLPGLISVFSATKKLSLGRMGTLKKITCCSSAFFVLGSFIVWVRCKGVMRFILNKPHGWPPTGKNKENRVTSLNIINERKGILVFCLLTFSLGIYNITNSNNMLDISLICLALLYPLTLLLSVITLGTSRMNHDVAIQSKVATVTGYEGYY